MVKPECTFFTDTSRLKRQRRQTRRRIIGTEPQTIFGARCQHSVRLGHALQNQVIDHDRQIAVGPVQRRHFAAQKARCRTHAGNQALRRGLFITRCAVNLTRTVEPFEAPNGQIGIESAWVNMVIFDRIARHDNLALFQTCHRPDHGHLDIRR